MVTHLVQPLVRPPDAIAVVPGSKSHTNRAVICAALAEGTSRLHNVLVADDTRAALDAVGGLGADVTLDEQTGVATIEGTAGRPEPRTGSVHVNQSGTTGRFVVPMAALASSPVVVDGHPQLRGRPFGPLVAALTDLGVETDGEVLPIRVDGRGRSTGRRTVRCSGSISSQFLSGLLLMGPCLAAGLDIELEDRLVSVPYVELTLSTMAAFGARVEHDDHRRYRIEPTGYRATDIAIEPDASAASYFLGAAAMTGGTVRVPGLGRDTVQGDIVFADVLADMGCDVSVDDDVRVTGPPPGELRGIEVDLADASDLTQTLAVVATMADRPTTIDGIGFIRHKEIDRIAVPVAELGRLGIRAEALEDGIRITPGRPAPGIVDPHDDHRMAMSFALLGLVHPGIRIDDPGCVSKTFPTYWQSLDQLR